MSDDLRIVSLLPSATEILHALGLGRYQVGRSHECDFPEGVKALPVCSRPVIAVNGSSAEIHGLVKEQLSVAASIYQLDMPLIRDLRPHVILTQAQCDVCAVSLEQVERAIQQEIGSDMAVVSLQPARLADVWDDIARVASTCGDESAGKALISSLRQRMEAIALRARDASSRPGVAAIEWLEPPMAGGNWIPELIEMAGGRSLFGEAGRHSPWLAWADVVAADPSILIAIPCGFDLERTRSEMQWLSNRPEWAHLRAVKDGRVFLCDGSQFMNRSGPRLLESLRMFAEICHPELFAPDWEGRGWQRY